MESLEGEKKEMLGNFSAMTNLPQAQAYELLVAADWNWQVALAPFMGDESKPQEDVKPMEEHPPQPASSQPAPTSSKPSGPRKGLATFSDYKSETPQDDDEENEYFTGGEKSGLAVKGPKDRDAIAKGLFSAAKKHGAVQAEPQQPSKPRFTGAGYRLGDEEGPSQVIPSAAPVPQPANEAEVTLTFWRDGFTIDDGENPAPLRRLDDASSRDFLTSIQKGQMPLELALKYGNEVKLEMKDKRDEEYKPPKRKIKSFAGTGHKLGSPAPPVVSSDISKPTSASTSSSAPPPKIDESQPVTKIQIRLADGTRMVAKFNHTNLVCDIRKFIQAARKEERPFVLMTTFPNKELTDENISLADAKLLNAVIVQKYS
eukprot:m.16931 g.16931  ORF g.16931 m.16931 type:complete len:372 (+) comp10840_c0_seq1:94-1209(+)